MKKFLFLACTLVACSKSPNPDNAPPSAVAQEVQAECEKAYSHCDNQCHHIGGTNSEEYTCTKSCSLTLKKCGK